MKVLVVFVCIVLTAAVLFMVRRIKEKSVFNNGTCKECGEKFKVVSTLLYHEHENNEMNHSRLDHLECEKCDVYYDIYTLTLEPTETRDVYEEE